MAPEVPFAEFPALRDAAPFPVAPSSAGADALLSASRALACRGALVPERPLVSGLAAPFRGALHPDGGNLRDVAAVTHRRAGTCQRQALADVVPAATSRGGSAEHPGPAFCHLRARADFRPGGGNCHGARRVAESGRHPAPPDAFPAAQPHDVAARWLGQRQADAPDFHFPGACRASHAYFHGALRHRGHFLLPAFAGGVPGVRRPAASVPNAVRHAPGHSDSGCRNRGAAG